MRKSFILAAVILCAFMLASSSWAATTEGTATLYITGTESIPAATITQEYTVDESGDLIAKGVKTYPAPSSSNRYTFTTVNDALKFAEGPASYIGEQSDIVSYDYKYEPPFSENGDSAITDLAIAIEISSLSSTVDFSECKATTVTLTATTAITPPANSRHFIVSGATSVIFSGLTLAGYSGGVGGGVLVIGGNAEFRSVTFRNISAPLDSDITDAHSQGGGIRIAEAGNNVTISGCNFTSCSAYDGGALYIGTDGVAFSG
ncbi:MAG: hypothetical protein IJQ58_08140, partial [Synergistaceae bacterium]|nr:hypothetical protein [Synergistaceae bacterium]